MSAGRCSELSRSAGESLAATATTALHWLLVEVRGGWSREVTSSDALPESAAEAVSEWRARTPGSRLMFVRRPGRTEGPHVAFVVDGTEGSPSVRRLELAGLEDLARADLSADGDATTADLVLVCGHGARDQCCALRGTAVFAALASELGPETLWISSHHGGHRFAANVLVLPAGLHLGRVEPDEASLVVRRALEGRISLDRYRGRTCYEPAAQAAERAIREARGLDRVDDLVLLGADGSTVRFRDRNGGEHAAVVEEVEGPVVPASCGDDPKPQTALVATLA